MTREDAKREILFAKRNVVADSWIDKAYDMAIQALSEPEPHWIPCSERLPENNCQCIVTAKVKHVDGYPDYEVDTADYTDGIFTTANGWWGIESIIAWMPLPECYRGKQDGKIT